jgi:hypothetical protein
MENEQKKYRGMLKSVPRRHAAADESRPGFFITQRRPSLRIPLRCGVFRLP